MYTDRSACSEETLRTKRFFPTEAFTQVRVVAQRSFFTVKRLPEGTPELKRSPTYSSSHSEKPLRRTSSSIQVSSPLTPLRLLGAPATHRDPRRTVFSVTEKLLRTDHFTRPAVTQRSFYTEKRLTTTIPVYTEAFTLHGSFTYTQTIYTPRWLYCIEAQPQSYPRPKCSLTQRGLYTVGRYGTKNVLLGTESFYTEAVRQSMLIYYLQKPLRRMCGRVTRKQCTHTLKLCRKHYAQIDMLIEGTAMIECQIERARRYCQIILPGEIV